ncbi:MAG: hypothetical protein ACKPKO_09410, partial [Candidatus Fonsibacter sp.]
LNQDLDNLAQKSEDDDDYSISVGSNFDIPDKPSERSNHIILEHIDEMFEIFRDQPAVEGKEEEESNIIYMIHQTDNLEAIVWQLYDAGFRPNIKNGAGKLSWVSLTVNNHTCIIQCQQMIDGAIDGMMEVQDTGVFNILQDVKTECHYQLFKSEHKRYYTPQDIDNLDECKTA